MIWPFKRKPKPVHVGPSSVDWKPGDMAECVRDQWHNGAPGDPQVGDKLMVTRIDYCAGNRCRKQFFLGFIGLQPMYSSQAFRKITLADIGADRKVSCKTPVSA